MIQLLQPRELKALMLLVIQSGSLTALDIHSLSEDTIPKSVVYKLMDKLKAKGWVSFYQNPGFAPSYIRGPCLYRINDEGVRVLTAFIEVMGFEIRNSSWKEAVKRRRKSIS